ncbi:hypothetical protein G6F58_013623 [Rhizopus delemar]|nr:hypothetical protein G6F58_013623 [Rhizopus delemar]
MRIMIDNARLPSVPLPLPFHVPPAAFRQRLARPLSRADRDVDAPWKQPPGRGRCGARRRGEHAAQWRRGGAGPQGVPVRRQPEPADRRDPAPIAARAGEPGRIARRRTSGTVRS